jgi:hypothetical protein
MDINSVSIPAKNKRKFSYVGSDASISFITPRCKKIVTSASFSAGWWVSRERSRRSICNTVISSRNTPLFSEKCHPRFCATARPAGGKLTPGFFRDWQETHPQKAQRKAVRMAYAGIVRFCSRNRPQHRRDSALPVAGWNANISGRHHPLQRAPAASDSRVDLHFRRSRPVVRFVQCRG